jgi:hypothetical protein
MAQLATHALKMLYKNYADREIAFNNSVIKVSGLEPKQVYLKVKGEQWSCVLYSCSMQSAKIIVNMDPQGFEILKQAKNFVNLRLSFLPPDHKNSIVFFIPTHIEGYKNFSENHKNTYLMNLKFTHKPPEDLIEILGSIIKEKEEFDKRQDIRISLEGKIIYDMGLSSNRGLALVENSKRTCIIRNLSSNGAMILMNCSPDNLIDKNIKILMVVSGSKVPLAIDGVIKRSESIQGRDDIHGIGVAFSKEVIPIEYQKMLNTYLNKLEKIAKNNPNNNTPVPETNSENNPENSSQNNADKNNEKEKSE